jgi:hypothetical protein
MCKPRQSLAILAVVVVLPVTACSSDLEAPVTIQPTLGVQADTTQMGTAAFPLLEGSYWVYSGTVKWEISGEVKQETLTWRMEVIEATAREGVVAGYALRGHPSDLAWYEEGREPSVYAIVQVGVDRFYKTSIDALERIRDEGDSLGALIHEGELFLELPLFTGKRFCEAEYISRLDGWYCWVVGPMEEVTLEGVVGASSLGTVSAYSVRSFTLPDHVIVEFVPGVGITRYEYVHHGTVSEVDVRLIEYRPGD